MKKSVVIFAIILASFAHAQKGTYLVLGSIGFNTNKQTNNNSNSNVGFSLNTKSGYQYNNAWTIGLDLNYSNNSNKSDNNGNVGYYKNNSNSISFGPFMRYTKKINDLFSVYSDFGVNYIYSKSESESYLNDIIVSNGSGQSNGFSTYIIPALFINLKDNFGLNFGVGGINYGSSTSNFEDSVENKNSGFSFNFGQTFIVGISKNF